MSMWKCPGALALLLAVSCGPANKAETPEAPVVPLPKEVCSQAQAGIEKLRESGGFVQKGPAEATIEEAAWLQMEPRAREQLEQLLAFDAACTAKQPTAEQTVTIRNEMGRVLSERVVETSADPSRILEN